MKMEMKKKMMMMMMGDPPEGPRPTEKAPELRKYLKESKVGMEDRQDPECLPFLHRAYLPVFSTSLLPGLHLPGVPPPNCTCPPASRTRTQDVALRINSKDVSLQNGHARDALPFLCRYVDDTLGPIFSSRHRKPTATLCSHLGPLLPPPFGAGHGNSGAHHVV
ncbi:uncharacterized protein CLUP02_12358 [Colletotrichum lupini]|uniref:Uncharacterized protein n=1 Tax=Colletotrichum lupini TaxID=145971 RepID=A0A9Q8WKQ3_9PEZI|nr:uncharacterized protein CLUP02_12358 [Colletotrichum lupini]UQC86856.1 hypothetical protein CLUP02_12358 [Colletotrichum lupini]